MNKKILLILLILIISAIVLLIFIITQNGKPKINNARIENDGVYITGNYLFFSREHKYGFDEFTKAKLSVLANLVGSTSDTGNVEVKFELENTNTIIFDRNILLDEYILNKNSKKSFQDELKGLKYLYGKLPRSIISNEKVNHLPERTGPFTKGDGQKAIDECYSYIIGNIDQK